MCRIESHVIVSKLKKSFVVHFCKEVHLKDEAQLEK